MFRLPSFLLGRPSLRALVTAAMTAIISAPPAPVLGGAYRQPVLRGRNGRRLTTKQARSFGPGKERVKAIVFTDEQRFAGGYMHASGERKRFLEAQAAAKGADFAAGLLIALKQRQLEARIARAGRRYNRRRDEWRMGLRKHEPGYRTSGAPLVPGRDYQLAK